MGLPSRRRTLAVLAAALLAAGAGGCREGGRTPGQKVDRALEKVGEAVKDAGEGLTPK